MELHVQLEHGLRQCKRVEWNAVLHAEADDLLAVLVGQFHHLQRSDASVGGRQRVDERRWLRRSRGVDAGGERLHVHNTVLTNVVLRKQTMSLEST